MYKHKIFSFLFWAFSIALGVATAYLVTKHASAYAGLAAGVAMTMVVAWWSLGTEDLRTAYENRHDLPRWFAERSQRQINFIGYAGFSLLPASFLVFAFIVLHFIPLAEWVRDGNGWMKAGFFGGMLLYSCATMMGSIMGLFLSGWRGPLTFMSAMLVMGICWVPLYPLQPPDVFMERTVIALTTAIACMGAFYGLLRLQRPHLA